MDNHNKSEHARMLAEAREESNRKKNDPSLFLETMQRLAQLAREESLDSKPVHLAVVGENIWCTQQNEISIWTKGKKKFTEKFRNHFLMTFVGVKLADLKPLRTHDLATNKIRHDLMREIQGVTQLHTGKVALACATGLHLLSSTGTNNFKKVNISKKSM